MRVAASPNGLNNVNSEYPMRLLEMAAKGCKEGGRRRKPQARGTVSELFFCISFNQNVMTGVKA